MSIVPRSFVDAHFLSTNSSEQFPEIWKRIFTQLSSQELARASRVCRAWRVYIHQKYPSLEIQSAFQKALNLQIPLQKWPKGLMGEVRRMEEECRSHIQWDRFVALSKKSSLDHRIALAKQQYQAGKCEEGWETLWEILPLINFNVIKRDERYEKIAKVLIEFKDFNNVLTVSSRILDLEIKDYVLNLLATAKVNEGDIAGGKEVALVINHPCYRSEAFREIAIRQIWIKDYRGLLESFQQIGLEKDRDFVYVEIVIVEVELLNIREAVIVAEKIRDPKIKDCALEAIASTKARRGDFVGALQVSQIIASEEIKQESVQEIVNVGVGVTFRGTPFEEFLSVIEAQVECGEFEVAIQNANAMHITPFKNEAFKIIALALFKRGEREWAEKISKGISGLYSNIDYSRLVKTMVRARALAGEIKEAIEISQRVVGVPRRRRLIKLIAAIQANLPKQSREAVQRTCAVGLYRGLFEEVCKDEALKQCTRAIVKKRKTIQ
ncbi:MAG: hypothetical protein S4CHLAM45_01200 [Chlamydiales bacterium]|nr:hypothetical protein [Chlamydiales bacterium]MCH9619440.1 hypothetical protein [Chlamydiales bacterium]MCH9622244.1 hypothetical protein [Chlamydiales bacterium]